MSPRPWVLGIASTSHNGSACLLRGNEMVVAVQEERLTRVKRSTLHAGVDSLAIRYCLDAAGITAADLDAVGICTLHDGHRDIHHAAANAALSDARCPFVPVTHHVGHAISAFAVSGFDDAAVLVIDGAGSFIDELPADAQRLADLPQSSKGAPRRLSEVMSLYVARPGDLVPVAINGGWWMTEDWPHAGMKPFGGMGGMYSSVAEHIFGDSLEGPGKVMGLAPFGTATIAIDEFFDMTDDRLAPTASAQRVIEAGLGWALRRLQRIAPRARLCYAGGVALNCVANEQIFRGGLFRDAFILPSAEDSGTALGAAFNALWQLEPPTRTARLRSDGLGKSYTAPSVEDLSGVIPALVVAPSAEAAKVARLLETGCFVGWFEGGSELGPRALGNRSILCDPRHREYAALLNLHVKRREGFRPFAPIVIAERAHEWFDVEPGSESPYMLRAWRFRPELASKIPAVVHCDLTGRVQTVTRDSHPRLHDLLIEFEQRTGIPLLLNTSLNVAGEPIIETPQEAVTCLERSGLDCCVFEQLIVAKERSLSWLTRRPDTPNLPLDPADSEEPRPAMWAILTRPMPLGVFRRLCFAQGIHGPAFDHGLDELVRLELVTCSLNDPDVVEMQPVSAKALP